MTGNTAAQLREMLLTEFRGADLRNNPADMSLSRSPSCMNMVRSVPNQVRKRMGYQATAHYSGKINGRYRYRSQEIIHAGEKLYRGQTLIYSGMNNARSCGFHFNDRLYLLDGLHFFYLDGSTFGEVSDIAYVPRVMISRNPDGTGGTVLESLNVLSDKWTESFYGTATDQNYQLSFNGLDDNDVTAQIMEADGVSWRTVTEGTEMTVNRTTGVVTFATAPGKSPVEGQDNVRITASRDCSAQRFKICGCDVCAAYDESGTGSRVFVTGCNGYPNRDFWSAQNDPTYFPDVNYSVLGQSNARIMGYSRIGDSLAAHKGAPENTVYVRKGEMMETADGKQEFGFRTGSVLTGHGAVSQYSFAALGSEPLFLTECGVCALTASDLTGERYEQSRSYFIDPALTTEANGSEAVAAIYRDFYVLAFPSGHVYLLDGLQKTYVKEQPRSSYQYECFCWDHIYARCLWTKDDQLYFGDEDGYIYQFYTDTTDPISYNDNGEPIEAWWQTADLQGTRFYAAKTFRRYSVRLTGTVNTSVQGSYRNAGGAWIPVSDSEIPVRHWQFSAMQFSKLCFSGDTTARTVSGRLAVHRAEKLALRFSNAKLHEPFGLEAIALHYIQTGRSKR